jgi:twitching motility protein PilT
MPDIGAILRTAVERNATDIHLQVGVPPMYRINKRLVPAAPERLGAEDIEQMLLGIMTETQRNTLRARMDCDFSCSVPGLARFRINVFRQRDTLAAAFRRIPFEIPSLETLGVPPAVVELTRLRRGFVLVTGAAGNGKSTTLASLIDRMNQERPLHIVTLEDPIEYLFQHRSSIVVQREIGTDAVSFDSALRAAVREDPDVILVGEMRDLPTIEAALTAAETGHLVFATLHTKTPAQGVDRIVDVFPSHQQHQIKMLLANVLHGILTQQLLVRKDGEGLLLACELLIATPAVRNLIREGKTFQIQTMIQTGSTSGMITMEQSLRSAVERGLISYDDALEHAFDPRELERLIGR